MKLSDRLDLALPVLGAGTLARAGFLHRGMFFLGRRSALLRGQELEAAHLTLDALIAEWAINDEGARIRGWSRDGLNAALEVKGNRADQTEPINVNAECHIESSMTVYDETDVQTEPCPVCKDGKPMVNMCLNCKGTGLVPKGDSYPHLKPFCDHRGSPDGSRYRCPDCKGTGLVPKGGE